MMYVQTETREISSHRAAEDMDMEQLGGRVRDSHPVYSTCRAGSLPTLSVPPLGPFRVS